MTKQERAIILEVAENVESGKDKFSCPAIWNLAMRKLGRGKADDLTRRYRNFYDQQGGLWYVESDWMRGADKEWRIMCLLTFAEVGE
jgi:hypothetical protein